MLDPAIFDAMLATGCSAEQIAAVAKAGAAIANEKQLAKKAAGRDRQRRYIEKAKQNQQSTDASVTSSDVSDGHPPLPPCPPSPPDKEKVSTPLKEINLPTPLYPPSPISTGWSKSRFDQFWGLYPNKVGRAKALEKFKAATKRASFEEIMLGLQRYVGKTDDRPWCNPATWLHQDRWDDIPATVIPFAQPKSKGALIREQNNATLAAIVAEYDAADRQDRSQGGIELVRGPSGAFSASGGRSNPGAHEGDGHDLHPVSGNDPARDLLAADRDGYQF